MPRGYIAPSAPMARLQKTYAVFCEIHNLDITIFFQIFPQWPIYTKQLCSTLCEFGGISILQMIDHNIQKSQGQKFTQPKDYSVHF